MKSKPSLSSVLGINGTLRLRAHKSTHKAHVILRRVVHADDSDTESENDNVVFFSLFAHKRIDVKPGKEILLTVECSEDSEGGLKDQAVMLEGDLMSMKADTSSADDVKVKMEKPDTPPFRDDPLPFTSPVGVAKSMPVKMRKSWIASPPKPKTDLAMTHASVGVQATAQIDEAAIQVTPTYSSAAIQSLGYRKSIKIQTIPLPPESPEKNASKRQDDERSNTDIAFTPRNVKKSKIKKTEDNSSPSTTSNRPATFEPLLTANKNISTPETFSIPLMVQKDPVASSSKVTLEETIISKIESGSRGTLRTRPKGKMSDVATQSGHTIQIKTEPASDPPPTCSSSQISKSATKTPTGPRALRQAYITLQQADSSNRGLKAMNVTPIPPQEPPPPLPPPVPPPELQINSSTKLTTTNPPKSPKGPLPPLPISGPPDVSMNSSTRPATIDRHKSAASRWKRVGARESTLARREPVEALLEKSNVPKPVNNLTEKSPLPSESQMTWPATHEPVQNLAPALPNEAPLVRVKAEPCDSPLPKTAISTIVNDRKIVPQASVKTSTFTTLQNTLAQTMTHPLPPKPLDTNLPRGIKRERPLSPNRGISPMTNRSIRKPEFDWPSVEYWHSTTLQTDGSRGVKEIVFNSDGSFFALNCFDKTIRVWDNGRQLEVARLSHRDPVVSIAWSDDDSAVVLLGEDGLVSEWSRKDNKSWEWAKLFDIDPGFGNKHKSDSMCMAHGGDRIAVYTPDIGIKVYILNQGSWSLQRRLHREGAIVRAMKFSQNGRTLVGVDNGVWRCEVPQGPFTFVRTVRHQAVLGIDLSVDHDYALLSHPGISMRVNLTLGDRKGNFKTVYETPFSSQSRGAAFAAVFAANGQAVLSGAIDGHVLVWDMKKENVVYGLQHPDSDEYIQCVASFDAIASRECILTATKDGRLYWWSQPSSKSSQRFSKRLKSE